MQSVVRACYKAYQSGFDVDLSDVNLDQLMNRSRSLSPHNVKKLREMRNANVQLPSIFDEERISEGSKGVVTILASESLCSKKRFLNQYGGWMSTFNDGGYDGSSALLGRSANPNRLMKVGFTTRIQSRPFNVQTYFREGFHPNGAHLLPLLFTSTEAAEFAEGFCIAFYKSLGVSVNERDEFPGSYPSRIVLSTENPGYLYLNWVNEGIGLGEYWELHRQNKDRQSADPDRPRYEGCGRLVCRNSATDVLGSQINLGQGRKPRKGSVSDEVYFTTLLERFPGQEVLGFFMIATSWRLNRAVEDIQELCSIRDDRFDRIKTNIALPHFNMNPNENFLDIHSEKNKPLVVRTPNGELLGGFQSKAALGKALSLTDRRIISLCSGMELYAYNISSHSLDQRSVELGPLIGIVEDASLGDTEEIPELGRTVFPKLATGEVNEHYVDRFKDHIEQLPFKSREEFRSKENVLRKSKLKCAVVGCQREVSKQFLCCSHYKMFEHCSCSFPTLGR